MTAQNDVSGSASDDPAGDARVDSKARMRLAVSEASRGAGSREELHAAAVQLVTELKDANHPPEQMLVQIKEILAESGLRPTYAKPDDQATLIGARESVYRDVIAWSIRYYYGDASDADAGHGGRRTDGPKAS